MRKVLGENHRRAVLIDKIKGVIYGHAIGDAIGLATEFLDKNAYKVYYPDGFSDYSQMVMDRHRSRWKPGEWTDDTDQMLCILKSIVEKKEVEPKAIAKRIFDWAYGGGKGIGRTVYGVISSPSFLFEPHETAQRIWISSGKKAAANGAVMRTSVLGVWNYNDFDEVKKNAEIAAKVTHFDPRCVASAVAVSLAIAQLLGGETDIDSIFSFVQKEVDQIDAQAKDYLYMARLSGLSAFQLDAKDSIGYTYKAMGAGFWALTQNDFKKAILEIVRECGDADTNAAVAGGLLGAKVGFKRLPSDWMKGLRNKTVLDRHIERLLDIVE
ncbi:MAG: ADP-ribosylglycohydrolase family protein [Okeania sp. SIO3C4]|nr:ADP-ribosylglycohydrolase family protein [Okeania sp. SIO3C4]